jgi:hypothetical protein
VTANATRVRQGSSQRAPNRPGNVVLVVACSARKRIRPHPSLRLRALVGLSARATSDEWRARLDSVDVEQLKAHDLYIGDHWSNALRAYADLTRWRPNAEMWVMSAGYGLVRGESTLKPYSATFATRHEDSVWRLPSEGERHSAAQTWWNALPHQIALRELIERRDRPTVLVVAGASYVEALGSDLTEAVSTDEANDRVFVVSAGSGVVKGSLPVEARQAQALCGTLSALNARTLAFLAGTIADHGFQRAKMERELHLLGQRVRTRVVPLRRRVDDPEVVDAIGAMRASSTSLSRSAALQSLRAKGIASEQGRFAAIWDGLTLPSS